MKNGQTEINQENGTVCLINMDKIKAARKVLEEVNKKAEELRNILRASVEPIPFDPLLSIDIAFEPRMIDQFIALEAFGEETPLYLSGVRIRGGKVIFYLHKDPEAEDDPFIYQMDSRLTWEMWEMLLFYMVIDVLPMSLNNAEEAIQRRINQIRNTGLIN